MDAKAPVWVCKHCKQQTRPLPVCENAGCNKPTDFPVNVQIAAAAGDSLSQAFRQCLVQMGDENVAKQLFDQFSRFFTSNFRVSMNVHPETLLSMLQDSRIRYTNLHDNLRANLVLDYDPELAAKRRGVDSLAFGSAGEKVTYGALNLGNKGLVSYGSICIFLRGESIRLRTSFLEKNSFSYVSGKLPNIKFDLTNALRAIWDTVATLAFVKHAHDLVSLELTIDKLADLILASAGQKGGDRFIEAQIFPPLTLQHFERILFDPRDYRPRGSDALLNEAGALSAAILEEAINYQSLFKAKLTRAGIEFDSGDRAVQR
jgi:hypothetical protein